MHKIQGGISEKGVMQKQARKGTQLLKQLSWNCHMKKTAGVTIINTVQGHRESNYSLRFPPFRHNENINRPACSIHEPRHANNN
jgi:hypothetical protein